MEKVYMNEEGKKFNIPKTCAVDFDGTLCEEDFPYIGAPKMDVISQVIQLRLNGWKIILWTNREGSLLKNAINWCGLYGLEFDAVNENIPERTEYFGNDCRKVGADLYIDDKSIRPEELKFKLEELR